MNKTPLIKEETAMQASAALDETRACRAGLQVDAALAAFLEDEVLPATGMSAPHFWQGLADLAARLTPRNRDLLARRVQLQDAIDAWHAANPDARAGVPEEDLRQMGYLAAEPEPFTISTAGVDTEIAELCGPQLVVPGMNARFLLNAGNARWGSLYDALYGTDALDGSAPPSGPLCAERSALVIAAARDFLDEVVPMAEGSWQDWEGGQPLLARPDALLAASEGSVLLRNNGLHIEVVIDAAHPIGRSDRAHIADVRMEAALSTIVDLEDSVAAVDAADKICGYRNWLGIMRGDLTASFAKGSGMVTRSCAPDRRFTALDGTCVTLPGRSLLLVRNVGHLMTSPAVLLPDGSEIFEGLMDAAITSLIALHDLRGAGPLRNSRTGSIYIVKPKMHGPQECAFANDLFDAVEDMLGLPRHSIKIGLMDEERRTSANLAACIHALRGRIFFINTGFLDRTGDEIHTSMLAGPMARKGQIKQTGWIAAYEDRNVQIGLQCGFSGRAQIGKGMWAAPDRMQQMMAEKIAHPRSGASTAWVPSPTAAVLHAMHYHRCDVKARQLARMAEPVTALAPLLEVPLAALPHWSPEEIRAEIDNNIQGILGYVVRWVDQGVGCSKVPDISNIGLMEDRATLRISSQHLANWLRHGVISQADVETGLARMAAIVDRQNNDDPAYVPMTGRQGRCLPMEAARALILQGADQPSGYTEPLLHHFRRLAKATT